MIRRVLVALATAVALLALTVPAAAAHDDLIATIPGNDYTVNTLPASMTFTFAEETGPEDVTVKHDGRALAVTAFRGNPRAVSVDLTGVSATKTVSLSWRAVDEHDGHVTSGTVAFHVLEHDDAKAAAGSSAASTGGPTQRLHALSVATHVVGYLAMAVLLGGLFFVSVLWPAGASDRRTRVLIGSAGLAGLASGLVGVYVATEQVAPLSFRDAIAQHFGRVSVTLALMWLLSAVVVVGMMQNPGAVRRTAWRVSGLVVAVGLIRAVGLSAHATQGGHALTGTVIDFVHLSAVSAWVGGLCVMTVGLLPRRRLSELEVVVPRFSKVAATSAVLLVASGTVLALDLVGSFGDLVSTHYGRVLLVKIALVGFVLLAAMASKRWVDRTLTSTSSSGRNGAVGTLVASVGAETALVIGVLSLASLLVTSNPGL